MIEEIRIEEYEQGTGRLIGVTDTRTLLGEQGRRIQALKAQCGELILGAIPLYKQNNAALGVYDDAKKSAIVSAIQFYRNQCDALEATVNACSSLEELDALRTVFSTE